MKCWRSRTPSASASAIRLVSSALATKPARSAANSQPAPSWYSWAMRAWKRVAGERVGSPPGAATSRELGAVGRGHEQAVAHPEQQAVPLGRRQARRVVDDDDARRRRACALSSAISCSRMARKAASLVTSARITGRRRHPCPRRSAGDGDRHLVAQVRPRSPIFSIISRNFCSFSDEPRVSLHHWRSVGLLGDLLVEDALRLAQAVRPGWAARSRPSCPRGRGRAAGSSSAGRAAPPGRRCPCPGRSARRAAARTAWRCGSRRPPRGSARRRRWRGSSPGRPGGGCRRVLACLTRTSPSTTDTREPLVPLLTEKMVPVTETRASRVATNRWRSRCLAAWTMTRPRVEVDGVALAAGVERQAGALAHLDAASRRPCAPGRSSPWRCGSPRPRRATSPASTAGWSRPSTR